MGSGFGYVVWADRDSEEPASANESGSVMPWSDETEPWNMPMSDRRAVLATKLLLVPRLLLLQVTGRDRQLVPKGNCPCNLLLPLILHKLKPGKRDTHDLGAASQKQVRLCKSVETSVAFAHDIGLAGQTPVPQRSTMHAGWVSVLLQNPRVRFHCLNVGARASNPCTGPRMGDLPAVQRRSKCTAKGNGCLPASPRQQD